MRAVLRADPDILGVGEIRDFDTAELTIHAVRSGHLCISSIHAESALGIYDRLAGMGVPRSDLASINLVAGFVYQALVPVLCENCKIPAKDACADTSKKAIFRRLQAVSEICDGDLNNVFFARPGGCEKCHHRGVVGRTVAAEFHRPTPAMLSHVAKQDAVGLWEMWRMESRGKPPDNMTGRTAMEHAIHKMFTGIIDPSHVEDKFKFLDDVPPPI
ncbi:MAG: Toxin coregulated pilus biosynthesis protein T [Chloroflexi bacterium]|nr:Toxin coregulated pilus biosynthesis protein T [Chloroflexota bacterium]